MKKFLLLFAILSLMIFSGCNLKPESANESTIIINRDGTIKSVIVESFPQDVYDEGELRQMIHDSISVYNNLHDSGDVKLISLTVDSDVARVEMLYNSGKDYAEFNNKDFYFGTVSAALDAGYAKSATLKNAHGDNTVSGSMINDLGTYHMIVSDENVNLSAYASVLYYSGNLEVMDDNTVKRLEDSSGLSYVIVK